MKTKSILHCFVAVIILMLEQRISALWSVQRIYWKIEKMIWMVWSAWWQIWLSCVNCEMNTLIDWYIMIWDWLWKSLWILTHIYKKAWCVCVYFFNCRNMDQLDVWTVSTRKPCGSPKKLVDDFGMNRIPGASQMRLSTVYHLCCGSQLLFAIDTELIGV